MLSMNAGPFAVSLALVTLMLAMLVAAGVGHVVGRRQQTGIGDVLIDMFVVALMMARIAFVIQWFDIYRGSPWSMLDVRDGGFVPWAGAVAAALMAARRGWCHAPLRRPLAAGLAAGTLAWSSVSGALSLLQQPALPQVKLMTLQGAPADSVALSRGKPMVVNLWASWCPPCRREMPMLVAAQEREKGVSFVFVNEGEDRSTVERYLSDGSLEPANVLLDPGARFGREVGSTALPTTLFYDAGGRLMDTHLGALSAASLADKLERLGSRADLSTSIKE